MMPELSLGAGEQQRWNARLGFQTLIAKLSYNQ